MTSISLLNRNGEVEATCPIYFLPPDPALAEWTSFEMPFGDVSEGLVSNHLRGEPSIVMIDRTAYRTQFGQTRRKDPEHPEAIAAGDPVVGGLLQLTPLGSDGIAQ